MLQGESGSMAEARPTFDDGAAYDEFMGRWSRAVGAVFLDWLAAPRKAAWLDVGCGTGAFTTLIVKTCKPARVAAVDPGAAQIEFARRQPVAKRADFRVADAQTLPFSDGTFDVVASALVINFIPDRARAVAQMRRVTRAYGTVGGYVWDFADDMSPSWPFNRALSALGIEPPQLPGTPNSTLEGLQVLFAGAASTTSPPARSTAPVRFGTSTHSGGRRRRSCTPWASWSRRCPSRIAPP